MATLHFGAGRTLNLDAEAQIATPPGAASTPVEEAADLVRRALSQPTGYPPLAACLAPGDRVALALGEGVPLAGELVDGVVAALREAGVDEDHIVVVAADAADARLLTDRWGGEVVLHVPAEESEMSFAGVTEADDPVVLNRRLLEADVAIPISCRRGDARPGEGAFGGLFPAFSDSEAIQKHNGPALARGAGSRFASAADEAGWLLGSTLVMQVVPDLVGAIAGAYAGPAEAVAAAAAELSEQLWVRPIEERAGLVIATVTGDESEQTWANCLRAIVTAERALAPGGAVALCTELAEPFEPRIAAALADEDPDRAARELADCDGPLAAVATDLLAAREDRHLYLLSRLDAEWVEDIGLAPVANERELTRLASRMPGCIVLEGAQHARVELAAEVADRAGSTT